MISEGYGFQSFFHFLIPGYLEETSITVKGFMVCCFRY